MRRFVQWKRLMLCLTSTLAFAQAGSDVAEIRLATDNAHGAYYFQPAALHVQPGQTVRFVSVHYFHTVTAFHPANGDPQARIPAAARPFDELLGDEAPGGRESFDVTFSEPGTYDFYCRFHASRGEVGRIVVGQPGGPAGQAPGEAPAPAQAAGYVGLSVATTRLPTVQRILGILDPARIVDEGSVSFPREELRRFGEAYHPVHAPIPD